MENSNIDANADERAPDETTGQLEIHVACSNLVNMDTFTKSDPIVVLFVQDGDHWVEHARTEMISDSLNPEFVKSLIVEYVFEQVQFVKFVCYDVDSDKAGLEGQDLIGETMLTLGELVTAPGQSLTKDLKLGTSVRGQISITAYEVEEVSTIASFLIRGENLDKKDIFGKSDPFVVVSRLKEGEKYIPILKTEVVRKTLNPKWQQFDLSLQSLCRCDTKLPIKFEVFDWNKSGAHTLIGYFVTSIHDLNEHSAKFTLLNPEVKAKKKHYVGSGTIIVEKFRLTKIFSFLDYLRGGCEINLITAIDFTASNGNPQYKGSLHFFADANANSEEMKRREKPRAGENETNEYIQVIRAVGEILGPYDTDQQFPVFGFGAKRKDGFVSHCFALNGNDASPEVEGVDGIIAAYKSALKTHTLYGPTIFSEVLKRGFAMASSHASQNKQQYNILLILTDGVLDDLEAAVDEIVKGNDLPLSIIIVGIGKADFTKMDVLDADDKPLVSSWGQEAKRDIVQFVPFSQMKNYQQFAKAILEEVPGQLLSYFKAQRIVPNEPKSHETWALTHGRHTPAYADAAYSYNSTGRKGNYSDVTRVSNIFSAPSEKKVFAAGPVEHHIPGAEPPAAKDSKAKSAALPYAPTDGADKHL